MSVCEQCVGIESVLECVSTYLIVDLVDVIREYLEREYIIGKPVEWDEKRVRRENIEESHLHDVALDASLCKKTIYIQYRLRDLDYNPMYGMEGFYAHRHELMDVIRIGRKNRLVLVQVIVPDVYVKFVMRSDEFIVDKIQLDKYYSHYFILPFRLYTIE